MQGAEIIPVVIVFATTHGTTDVIVGDLNLRDVRDDVIALTRVWVSQTTSLWHAHKIAASGGDPRETSDCLLSEMLLRKAHVVACMSAGSRPGLPFAIMDRFR